MRGERGGLSYSINYQVFMGRVSSGGRGSAPDAIDLPPDVHPQSRCFGSAEGRDEMGAGIPPRT